MLVFMVFSENLAPESFIKSQDRDDVKTLMERLDLEQMKGRG